MLLLSSSIVILIHKIEYKEKYLPIGPKGFSLQGSFSYLFPTHEPPFFAGIRTVLDLITTPLHWSEHCPVLDHELHWQSLPLNKNMHSDIEWGDNGIYIYKLSMRLITLAIRMFACFLAVVSDWQWLKVWITWTYSANLISTIAISLQFSTGHKTIWYMLFRGNFIYLFKWGTIFLFYRAPYGVSARSFSKNHKNCYLS